MTADSNGIADNNSGANNRPVPSIPGKKTSFIVYPVPAVDNINIKYVL